LNHPTPLVSIVTVSLNAAATIEDTLASVSMQQTRFDVEHICVDGGSTDGTRAAIDRWAAHAGPIERIYERDAGIYDAMNKGLRAAHGEYVLYLNADDFLAAADSLAAAMAGIRAGDAGNPDLVVGDVAMGWPGRRGVWRHRRVPRALARLRGSGLYPIHPAQFTRRRLLDAVGGFAARLALAADVVQYYDLERLQPLAVRVVARDLVCMRPGGAANAGLAAMRLGTAEIFRHLVPSRGRARAAAMVLVKTLQSVLELRYGRCPHARWFAAAAPLSAAAADSRPAPR
jgi:glycosyltransferase involved in cell wall biosynthesis